jgi:hypothetical protein
MLDTLLRDLVLSGKAKTGVSGEVAIWLFFVVLCAVAALGFLSLGAYAWLWQLYGPVAAGIALGCFYLAAMAAITARSVAVRRRTQELARAELASGASGSASAASWLDPRLLAVGFEVGRMIGWRRVLPLVAAGLLVTTLASERSHTPARKS